VRASGISNAEGVLGEESQDSMRIVEGSWDLVTDVGNGRGDPDTSTWVLGTDVLTARPRGAETTTAKTRATRGAWMEEDNTIMKAVEAVNETVPMEPWD